MASAEPSLVLTLFTYPFVYLPTAARLRRPASLPGGVGPPPRAHRPGRSLLERRRCHRPGAPSSPGRLLVFLYVAQRLRRRASSCVTTPSPAAIFTTRLHRPGRCRSLSVSILLAAGADRGRPRAGRAPAADAPASRPGDRAALQVQLRWLAGDLPWPSIGLVICSASWRPLAVARRLGDHAGLVRQGPGGWSPGHRCLSRRRRPILVTTRASRRRGRCGGHGRRCYRWPT